MVLGVRSHGVRKAVNYCDSSSSGIKTIHFL